MTISPPVRNNRAENTDVLIERLHGLDACAVSDALDSVGLKGVAIGIRQLIAAGRIAGRVVTVKLKDKGSEVSKRHLGVTALEAASPGDIIVVDNRGRVDVASWGGLLSTAARAKNIGGVIIDGACRDLDQSSELGFPVFARTAVPVTARGRVVEESCNQPIGVSGVSVSPGDLVIADASGVVFIPARRAAEVIALAERIAAREAEMVKGLLSGRPVSEVLGASYESMMFTEDR